MSGLDNINARVRYIGASVQDRYKEDKLRGLKAALKFSYQSEVIILEDGREFLSLINPDKVKINQDNKILSIPFKDVCLNKPRKGKTTQGYEEVGIKPGSVFTWKENGTHWLVYMQQLQEQAYFKSEIRRCRHTVTFGEKDQWVYINQPAVQNMIWTTKQDRFSWNDINYKLELYVTRDETTSKQFQRFTKIKIDGNTWEVVSSDKISAEGIIIVYLREYYNNPIEDARKEELKEIAEAKKEALPEAPVILGQSQVYPYELQTYTIDNMPADGVWSVDNPKDARILQQDECSATIEIIAGKTDKFNLIYTRQDIENDSVALEITIQSL